MAKNNRTEAKAAVTANIAATVTVSKHTSTLNDEILDGVVMEKDVNATFSGTSGTLNASFTTNTQLIANLTGDATFNILNVQDGGRYKLIVNKGASDNVSFSGITGSVDGQVIGKTVIHYEVWSANSKIYVSQINRQSSGSIAIGELTAGTNQNISSVTYFDYQINDNTIDIFGQCQIELTTSATSILKINLNASRKLGTNTRTNILAGTGNGLIDSATSDEVIMVYYSDDGTNYEFAFRRALGDTWPIGFHDVYFHCRAIIK